MENTEKINNYIVSYTKNGSDVDMSIGSEGLDKLTKTLKKSMTKNEFDSIFKIEIGIMPFG